MLCLTRRSCHAPCVCLMLNYFKGYNYTSQSLPKLQRLAKRVHPPLCELDTRNLGIILQPLRNIPRHHPIAPSCHGTFAAPISGDVDLTSAQICWYLAAVVQIQLCKYFIQINDAARESTVWGEINVLR